MDDTEPTRLAREAAGDKLKGRMKEVAGDLVGSDALAAKGRLQQQEGRAKEEAADLTEQAQLQQDAAEQVYLEETAEAAEERRRAREESARRERELQAERQQAHHQVERQANAREDAIARDAAQEAGVAEAHQQAAEEQRREGLEDAAQHLGEARDARREAAEIDELTEPDA